MPTFARAEDGRIDEEQQEVVEEALQHGRLHPGIHEALTAHCCATDQQGQDLPHEDGLQQTPAEGSGRAWRVSEIAKCNPTQNSPTSLLFLRLLEEGAERD